MKPKNLRNAVVTAHRRQSRPGVGGSAVECLPSMCKALRSVPSPAKTKVYVCSSSSALEGIGGGTRCYTPVILACGRWIQLS